jgi:hydrogenase maturation protease
MSVFANYNDPACLIYGIGNIGRQDDGLGWAFLDWLEAEKLCPAAELNWHYQLQLEDADLIHDKKRVLFVDASKNPALECYQLETVQPNMDSSFTSHALSISSVMAICKSCFEQVPEVHLLTIRGYEWALQQGLSPKARNNLALTSDWFRQQLARQPVYA